MVKFLPVLLKKKEPMSKEGIKKWSKKNRYKIKHFVYKTLPQTRYMPIELCSNKEGLCQWLKSEVSEGYILICIYYKGRKGELLKKYMRKNRVIAEIELLKNERYKIYSLKGISKMKFWNWTNHLSKFA